VAAPAQAPIAAAATADPSRCRAERRTIQMTPIHDLPYEQLERMDSRYEELLASMGTPEVATDPARLRAVGREQAELEPIVAAWRALRGVDKERQATEAMMAGETDPDMVELAQSELGALRERHEALSATLTELLLPRDPDDRRGVILEIRAGTGGDEASLFAADLYRMYERYAALHGWTVNVISHSATEIGGLREIICEVKGRDAFARLKWESGVHRVQRIPETESSGRIHTSTATVAVLPAIDEIEVDIPENDIRVDVFRSSGPGGQSVNTTDSAVRVTHLPTGIVISCQDEKSQLQNRRKALQVLRARLYQMERERVESERGAVRRDQVGTGERSEKIRTYNFPQGRVTDHRIGLTTYRLDEFLAGSMDEFVDALQAWDRANRLESARAG
jgi:peptide chain release factor 1